MTQNDSLSVSGGSRNSYRSNWSVRRFILSALIVAVGIGLVYQGIIYIQDGVGGFVPYLMIFLGPSLAFFYIWYLLFRVPEEDTA